MPSLSCCCTHLKTTALVLRDNNCFQSLKLLHPGAGAQCSTVTCSKLAQRLFRYLGIFTHYPCCFHLKFLWYPKRGLTAYPTEKRKTTASGLISLHCKVDNSTLHIVNSVIYGRTGNQVSGKFHYFLNQIPKLTCKGWPGIERAL